MYFDRFDVCEAYYWYHTLWGPSPYGARLHKINFRPGCSARLENATDNAKVIYGRIVRDRERIYVAFERFSRRKHAQAPSWPGTRNMPGNDPYAWLRSRGILDAVLSYV